MRMTCSSLCNIYENVDMIRYEAFVIVAKTKGVPRQRQRKWCHDNIPVPVTRLRCRCKRKSDEGVSKYGGVIPVTGFPRFDDGDKAKEGQDAPTI